MGNLIPNTTQIPNIVVDRYMRQLSDTALRLLLIIMRKTYGWIADQETGMRKQEDWIAYSQLKEFSGRENEAVTKAIKELESKELVEVRGQDGKILEPENRRGKKLFYRFKTSPKSGEDAQNITEKRCSESGDTKETNTKVLSKDNSSAAKKQPSCPLLNGSPLREKYPQGHQECIEYYLSVEERKGRKFINPPKQFKNLHKILRAGYGFEEMNRTFPKIEKEYGRGNWDFGTLANWLEKGGSNG